MPRKPTVLPSERIEGSAFHRVTGFSFGSALAVVVGYWLAVTLLDAATDVFFYRYFDWEISPAILAIDQSVWFGSWIPLAPLVLVLVAWAHPQRLGWARSGAVHLGAQVGLILLHALLASLIFQIGSTSEETVMDRWLRLTLSIGVAPRDLFMSLGQIAVFYALSFRALSRRDQNRVAELAAQSSDLSRLLAEAQLEALRRELNPHVIFNALNSISTFVREGDRTRALRMIAGMSDLLRSYLKRSREELVSLEEELGLLDRYLEMERVRLEDKLEVRITIDPGVGDVSVPPFLLQPIVENAIKHGVTTRDGGSLLEISVKADEEKLWIYVSDGARERRAEQVPASGPEGIGLSNTRRRLDALFGDAAGLSLSVGPASACTKAWLPIRRGLPVPVFQ